MDLLLWRHAEAADGAVDMARPLTPRGLEQAAAVAAWLKRHGPQALDVLVSPAVRTRQTADALQCPYRTVDHVSTSANAQGFLQAAGWPRPGRSAVLVVGHQPTLGRVASLLLTGRELPWHVERAGLWWISSPYGDGEAMLRAVVHPDMT